MNPILLSNIIIFGGLALVLAYLILIRVKSATLPHAHLHKIACAVLVAVYVAGVAAIKITDFDKTQGMVALLSTESGTYSGMVKNDLPQGKGVLTLSDGTVITGEFNQGYASGTGSVSFPNIGTYEGQLKDNKMDGQGTLTKNTDQGIVVYTGSFSQSFFSGSGTISYPDGSHYEGPVKNFEPNTESGETGVFTLADGSVYRGEFKNSNYYGDGEFVCGTCGHTYKGKWQNNFMNGAGTLVRSNGTVLTGIWENDCLDNKLFSCDNAFYAANTQINGGNHQEEASKSFREETSAAVQKNKSGASKQS